MIKALVVAVVAMLAIPAAQASAAPKTKFRFSASSYTVSEGVGQAQVTINKTRGSSGSVSYSARSGSAIAGSDFTAVSGTLTFAANESSKSFNVPIIDDGAQENPETVLLNLTPARGSSAANPRSTLTIADNDGAARLSFETAAASASENAGSTTLKVIRSGDTLTPLAATLGRVGGNAPAGDYSFTDPTTVALAANELSKTVTVGLNDNAIVDRDRTVVFRLTGAAVVAPSDSTLTIVDDDSPSALGFDSSAPWSTGEGDGVFLVTLRRTGDIEKTATVQVDTINGTAVAGSDYESLDPTDVVYFDAGEAVVSIGVAIVNDQLHENAETFGLGLQNASGATLTGNSQSVTINDDDAAPTISIVETGSTPTGPGTSDVTVTVGLSGPSGTDTTVTYTILDGSGNPVGTGTVTIPAGQTTVTITVPVEGEGPFTVVISNPSGGTIAPGGASASSGPASTGTGSSESGSSEVDTAPAGDTAIAGQVVAGAQQSGCRLTVKAVRKQAVIRRKAILLRLKSAGKCTVSIKASARRITLSASPKPLARSSATLRSKTTTVKLTPGKATTVKVRFTRKALSALRKSLRRKPVTARVNVSEIDETGRKSSRTLKVKIRK